MEDLEPQVHGPDLLKLGLQAAIAEDYDTAREALWRVVADDPHHEVAWQWLAKVAENRGEESYCLARAVALDPKNERRRLSLLLAQEEGADDAKPQPRGQCHFCDLPWAQEPERCARCRGYQELADPQIFLEPLDVDARLLRRCVDRLNQAPSLDAAGRRVLALGYLNLGELLEALSALRRLAEHDPRDEPVRALLLAVSAQLDAIRLESGFETQVVERPSLEELGIV